MTNGDDNIPHDTDDELEPRPTPQVSDDDAREELAAERRQELARPASSHDAPLDDDLDGDEEEGEEDEEDEVHVHVGAGAASADDDLDDDILDEAGLGDEEDDGEGGSRPEGRDRPARGQDQRRGTGADRGSREAQPRPAPRPQVDMRKFSNVRDMLLQGVAQRAKYATPKLRAQLVSPVFVEIKGGRSGFLFEFSGEEPRVSELSQDDRVKQAVADPATAENECRIVISEDHLMAIAGGELNAQIAMLSDKVRLLGKPAAAIYFFNLVAPGGDL